nr:MAG TPA: hypothetical protein [Caudoviricetes sp.]
MGRIILTSYLIIFIYSSCRTKNKQQVTKTPMTISALISSPIIL